MFESFDDLMDRLKATGYFIDPVMTGLSFWPPNCKSHYCSKDLQAVAKRN